MKHYLLKQKPVFEQISEKEKKTTDILAADYCDFLDNSKTERASISSIEKILKKNNFKSVELFSNIKKLPEKFYIKFRDKNLAAISLNKNLEKGINFLISHIDSPRIDLKQNPLTEKNDCLMLKTHYYGGIKKYQWVNVPLALCGTIFNVKGEKLDINIGSDEKDPVLIIPDLEPHLSHKIQNDKKIREAITGEALNPVAGTLYNPKDKENKLKNYVLNILHKKYGIVEKSLLSAELQLVPAGRSRFSGLDSSLIAGYGHDDRCCAYASLKALTDSSANQKTSICLFYDKEEIGSEGATGAKSKFIEDIVIFLNDIVNRNSTHSSYRKIFLNSNVLSADVNAVVNPNFPEVHELQNAAKIGYGIVVTKFTGSGGKYSANDADAEYLYKLTSAFDRHKVIWQIGELGKVDEGGGGTIAKYIAELGANVIDCGIGVMSMHSPYELISKYDLYSGYKAYAAFLKM